MNEYNNINDNVLMETGWREKNMKLNLLLFSDCPSHHNNNKQLLLIVLYFIIFYLWQFMSAGG